MVSFSGSASDNFRSSGVVVLENVTTLAENVDRRVLTTSSPMPLYSSGKTHIVCGSGVVATYFEAPVTRITGPPPLIVVGREREGEGLVIVWV